MSNTIDGSTSIKNALYSTGTSSIQLMFAELQMKLSQDFKEKALEKMDTIKKSQELAKQTADMIAKARDLQNTAKNSGGCSTMPADMKAFFNQNGLKWETTGNDDLHNKDEWEYNIKSLTNFQEQVGADTQQLMVFIQDFMGQYNAYLNGANASIRESNQTLAGLARNQ
jgi:hypothetical protein